MQKVLLVEDDDTMRSLLETFLELEGYQVVSLTEDDDILDVVRLENPELILLDVHLRDRNGIEKNGFDLLHKIRNDPKLSNVKILMSSGMDFRYQCLDMGADDFLQKPYMPEDLIEMIKGELG